MVGTISEQAKETFQLENISLVQSNGHHFENTTATLQKGCNSGSVHQERFMQFQKYEHQQQAIPN